MQVGVVIIGRNEGERLRCCIEAVLGQANEVVYVDSGSSDGSVDLAISLGAAAVSLDMSMPFTAARARNAGFSALKKLAPNLEYVQFVDGDCAIAPGWLAAASCYLDNHPDVAMVCGRLRERFPERSVYNLLCDFEWDVPPGESQACGGNAMARAHLLEAAGGYRQDLICGEEPELCLRLRANGWKIWRLPQAMAWHDAAMTQFSQWWRRNIRNGYAFAQGAHIHGKTAERHGIRESRRIWFWGCALPSVVLVLAALTEGRGLLLFGIYPVQMIRLTLRGKRSLRENSVWAFFNVLGKFPELLGQLKFHANHFLANESRLIEYK